MNKINKIISMILIIMLLTINMAFADIDVSKDVKGALLGDLDSGEILYEYNIKEKVELASVTKLMTYLVMREAIENGDVSVDDNVFISKNAAETEGSSFGLVEGETFKLSDLIEPLLVVSGNDVAVAIAEHVGGTEDKFIEMMYKKAEEIGITSARFICPNGLPIDDEETDQNYMSTEDIFKLARYILQKYPEITEITSKKELVIPERKYEGKSTNYQLLTELPGVDGLKTGYTHKARCCLVSTIPVINKEDQNKNYRLIAIVMGAYTNDERTEKSKALLEYGMKDYIKEKIVDKTVKVETITIENAKDQQVDVYPAEDYYKLIKNGTKVRTEIEFDTSIKAPLAKGDSVGKINLYIEDEKIDQVDIVVNQDVQKANIFVRFVRFIKGIFGL